LDFVLDFFDKQYLQLHLFTIDEGAQGGGRVTTEMSNGVRGRVTFAEIMKFIEEASTFKHSKADYRQSLGHFTRGAPSQKGAPPARANMEDIKQSMKKYTDMTE
jgi:hypothetical protein